MSEPIEFRATFPPIQSAIKVGTDGMRVQFDIPESEMGNAVHLLALRNVVLKITVEVEQSEPTKQEGIQARDYTAKKTKGGKKGSNSA
jgi:hypothetical protein